MNAIGKNRIESLTGIWSEDSKTIQAHLGSLYERVADMRESVDKSLDFRDFNRRLEALKAAREHVAGLPEQQPNSKGYRDGALKGQALLTEELRVASFLLRSTSHGD